MSWVKRNLYFVISCVVAVALLIAAGWYCYSSWQSNSANKEKLDADYAQLSQLPTISQTNVDLVREQTKDLEDRAAQMRQWFPPVPGIPDTNHLSDQLLASAVRQTVGGLRSAAAAHSVVLPTQPDFTFSFSLQETKASYDPNSWDHLAKQLGEVRAICDILFASRISQLDAIQRERTADDVNPQGGSSQPDYIDSTSITNQYVVITPYQVTFQCFTPELGTVLSSFANQPHTFVVKTLNIQPQENMMGVPEPGANPYGGYENRYGNTGYGNTPATQRVGPATTVIDEKKLKVVMQVDIVKKVSAPGR